MKQMVWEWSDGEEKAPPIGPDCDFSKEILAFMGKVGIGYGGVVVATIVGVPRITALFKTANGNHSPQ